MSENDYGFTLGPRKIEKRKFSDVEESEQKVSPTNKIHRRPERRYAVKTSNRFQALSPPKETNDNESDNRSDEENSQSDDCESENEITMVETGDTPTSTPKLTQTTHREAAVLKKKSATPTPIVIHGNIQNQTTFNNNLRKIAPGGFNLKNTMRNTQIFVENQEEKNKIIEHLKSKNIEFHTYTNKQQKTHAFILKGIATNPTVKALGEELARKYKITPQNVFQLKTKNVINLQLYMVITDSSITLKKLRAEVKTLAYTVVTWEKQVNKKGMIQCHNCQIWGHATSNCHAKTKCMICAQDHETKKCPPNSVKKCVNCDGDHEANSTDCEVYLDRKRFIDGKRIPPPDKRASNPPNTEDRQQFPRLKKRSETRENPWTTGRNNTTRIGSSSRNTNIESSNNKTNALNFETKFQTLENEIKEMNNLINLDEAIRAIRDLNELLRMCEGKKMEKLQTLKTFMENLDSYDF